MRTYFKSKLENLKKMDEPPGAYDLLIVNQDEINSLNSSTKSNEIDIIKKKTPDNKTK